MGDLRELKAPDLSAVDLLNYGPEQGAPGFRAELAAFLERQGVGCGGAEELFTTSGNSHGMNLLCSLLCRPDSLVLVEEPVYMFAIRIFRNHTMPGRVRGVPADSEGTLDVGALRGILEGLESPPVFLYVIPSYSNPTGLSLSSAKRAELVSLAHEFDFLLLCDDVYQMLSFGAEPPAPPMLAFEADTEPSACRVVSLGTFSKIYAPALRLGWIQTRLPSLMERLTEGGEVVSGGGPAYWTSCMVTPLLAARRVDAHLAAAKAILARRSATLCSALRSHFPADNPHVRFEDPTGGYFIWVRLLGDRSAADALVAARSPSQSPPVTFWSGPSFAVDGAAFPHHLRLSYAFYDDDDLIRAAHTIAKVIKGEQ